MLQHILMLTLALVPQAGLTEDEQARDAQPQDSSSPSQQSPRSERVARDIAVLQGRVDQEADKQLHEFLLELTAQLLAIPDQEPFVPSALGRVKRKEPAFLQAWNTTPEGGVAPAMNFESPDSFAGMLRAYARELEELGIQLLVVPIPLRIQIYPEHLEGVPEQLEFTGYGAGMAPTLLSVAEDGIEVLDLLPAFSAARYGEFNEADERLYFDYDLHWTPRGVGLAADEIAGRIKRTQWFTQGPERQGDNFLVKREQGNWSILNNKKLDLLEARRPVKVWFERVLTEEGESAHEKDAQSQILLIGDSFSGIFNGKGADMASLLYARLGHRIDTITLPGGGSSIWKSLSRRGKDGMKDKRVVIWLCSVRDFNRKHKYVPLFSN